MNYRITQFASLVIMILTLVGCKSETKKQDKPVHVEGVQYAGSLQTIMKGELDATISLTDLKEVPNLYALGAAEGLQGEIQIFNGVAYNSEKTDEMVNIDRSFDDNAAMLVYAQVPKWKEVKVPAMVKSDGQFAIFVKQAAQEAGVDVSKPFPFMLSGPIAKLNCHIVDWDENNPNHNRQSHLDSGLNGVLANQFIDILGFYSEAHKGVFTHHDSNLHMHFKTETVNLAGHVDYIFLGSNMTLKLPEQ